MRFRPWCAQRPSLAEALVVIGAILGMFGGVAVAAACVAHHLVLPDNPLAGGAIGFGAVLAGAAAALLAVVRLPAPRTAKRSRTR